MRRVLVGAVAIALCVTATPAMARAPMRAPTAADHLAEILRLSPAPEYRRFGTAAMGRVAGYAAGQLAKDHYEVVRDDVGGLDRWAVDYGRGHRPSLVRLADRHAFKTESAFDIASTPSTGIECTVKKLADVGPGDCGFVPFSDGSPEWKNVTFNAPADVASIVSKGGVGAVVQGDTTRNLVYSVRLHTSIPAVVSVVGDDIVGQRVRLRAMGASVPAVAHNVIGILRPPVGASQYVALMGHMDGWFQAAADNGGGAAGVLRAADELEASHPGVGVLVALFDGEEYGLLGSKRFAAELSSPGGVDGVQMSELKAVMNLDASSARASEVQDPVRSVAGHDAPIFSWRAMVFSEEPTLASLFISTFAAHGVFGLPVTSKVAKATIGGGSWRTDAQWFGDAGVPVAWPVAGYPEYHTDGDLPSAMDKHDLDAVADAAADFVGKVATAPIGPVPEQLR
ncbi:MAG: M28 family peptidase [Acidimicrobiia bacterium]|nr:M28 family peptidase [Acidimicrobiia bacterium]